MYLHYEIINVSFKNNTEIRLGLLTPELSKHKKKGMDKKY